MKRLKQASMALLSLFGAMAHADYAGEWDQAMALEKMQKGNLLVVDVRSAEEFAEGHVPGAINIPHNELEQHMSQLAGYENKALLIYCRSGRRAGVAESELSGKGFTQIYHLKGDMIGWEKNGQKIEK
ncbi:MAG: rhodanese-like domain-containing protein [Pseudomonadales bacterium]|nr:rhodanese-like domain-containing protein [Pseudomonadales bacterium]